MNYNLKPADIERMDPDLVIELLARITAQAVVEENRRKAEERERKRELRKGAKGEDVSLAEIK